MIINLIGYFGTHNEKNKFVKNKECGQIKKGMWTTRERENSIFSYSQSYPQYPQVTKVDKYDK